MSSLIKDLNIVLRHVHLAQGALTEYLLPDSKVTAEETVNKLLEVLDDKKFLTSQQNTENNLEKLIKDSKRRKPIESED